MVNPPYRYYPIMPVIARSASLVAAARPHAPFPAAAAADPVVDPAAQARRRDRYGSCHHARAWHTRPTADRRLMGRASAPARLSTMPTLRADVAIGSLGHPPILRRAFGRPVKAERTIAVVINGFARDLLGGARTAPEAGQVAARRNPAEPRRPAVVPRVV